MASPIHIGRGGGYYWQWLLATDIILRRVCLREPYGISAIDRAVERIGPITSVAVEGELSDGGHMADADDIRQEDFTLTGERGRLHIQAKAKQDATKYWTDGAEQVKEFRARANSSPDGLFLFISNAQVSRLVESDAQPWANSSICVAQSSELPVLTNDGAPSGELVDSIARRLGHLGCRDPERAALELVARFATASIGDGGHRFNIKELQEIIEGICLPPTSAPIATGYRRFESALRGWPQYDDLESGRMIPREEAAQAYDLAIAHKIVAILGDADQGKSVVARMIGFRAVQEGKFVAFHDAGHDGRPADTFNMFAAVRRRGLLQHEPSWIILDNPHVERGLIRDALDAWEQTDREVTLVIAARGLELQDRPMAQETLSRSKVAISLEPLCQQQTLAKFWLVKEHNLAGSALQTAAAAVQPYAHGGHLLREAIRVFDVNTGTTSHHAILDHLWSTHLECLRPAHLPALEILYVVAGLFRSEVRTDPVVLPRLLGRDQSAIEPHLDLLQNRGLIRRSEHDGCLSMTHETLARLYWLALAAHPETTRRLRDELSTEIRND